MSITPQIITQEVTDLLFQGHNAVNGATLTPPA